MEARQNKIVNFLLYALIVFLPLSAWLVSLFGNEYISLGRDFILIILAIYLILTLKWRPKISAVNTLAVLFLVWGLLSYFWREESAMQWLRGVRYYLAPIVLFLLIKDSRVKIDYKKILTFALVIFGLITLFGFVQYVWPNMILFSFAEGGRGHFEFIGAVGNFARMQSTLAGPNALGLYALTMILLATQIKNKNIWWWLLILLGLAGLVLTFSRSAWIGFAVGMLAYLITEWRQLSQVFKVCVVIIFVGALAGLYFAPRQVLLHGTSNEERLSQYHRISGEWRRVGLTGRGIGSAGLVSQYRLDGGENNYSENIYLDIFEGLGFGGVILFVGFWLALIIGSLRNSTMLAMAIGIAVAGLFITNYTGQAGLWLFYLFAGLMYAKQRNV